MTATRSFGAIGTTAVVAVTNPHQAERAEQVVRNELVAIDVTCSRFRADSELRHLNSAGGTPVRVSALLFDAVRAARDVAQQTQGAVDPTVGTAMEALGYDVDFDDIDPAAPPSALSAAPGWWTIELNDRQRTVRIPSGTHLDLGASAKALVADRAAQHAAAVTRTGVLVSVGGDVAVSGPAPDGGWAVAIAISSSAPFDAADQIVAIFGGGLASSSTAVRTWRRGTRRVHHIVDPATGDSAAEYWRLVSATGESCVDANAASTAAVVWGRRAEAGLRKLGNPARLVRHNGEVLTLNGWPPADAADVAEASSILEERS
jgi:thiamine biosynthesis lipoprotein